MPARSSTRSSVVGPSPLYAKARGYRVICNDVAERSHIIGKALIENDHVRLTHDDLVRVAQPREEIGYAQANLVPDVFPVDHGQHLDAVLGNARCVHGVLRWLVALLVVHQALKLRPMGNFGAKTIMRQAAAGRLGGHEPSLRD